MAEDGGARELKRALTDPHSRSGIVIQGCLTDYDDIISEILARLPVKTLKRFQCVCKPWRALIANPYFVKKHFDYAERGISDNPSRLLISMRPPRTLDYQALNNLDLEEEDVDFQFAITALDLPVRFPDYSSGNIEILGSCKGLVCVFVKSNDNVDKDIVLWNPSTRETSKVLPKQPETFKEDLFGFYGFGYDSTTDDYKIVVGVVSLTDITVPSVRTHIFALKKGSWTSVCEFNAPENLPLVCGQGRFLNGALHWCGEDDPKVVSFNLEKEKFEDIVQLPCHDVAFLRILVFRNCLCVVEAVELFDPPDFSWVWMMKEYGVAESWTRVLKFSNVPDGECLIPLLIFENGAILMSSFVLASLRNRWIMVLVNQTKSKTVCEVAINLGGFSADVYRDSLFSPVI